MRSTSILVGLVASVAAQSSSGSGHTTRYWDCCKPSCAWPAKAAVSQPVRTCDRNDNPLAAGAVSGCDPNGVAFTCNNNIPWAVNNNLAYGFAATAFSGGNEASWCCACYALEFTSGPVVGKTMVVQSTNTGGDLNGNHFDIQMPGGGLGIFDGCTPQFGVTFPGNRYGGTTSRSQCAQIPSVIREGCHWRYDWFNDADNPNVNWRRVRCPAALTQRSGCVRNDDNNYPVFVEPGPGTPPTTTSSPPQPTNGGGGGTAAPWGQCGGQGWSGPTACASGSTCNVINPWYSQCIPN